MQARYEVVIAGAGPAGSVLALLLARAGAAVLLLDRATFPRPKPCGDCLSAEATRLLDRLGLLPDVLACAPALLRGWRILGPDQTGFTTRFEDFGDPDPHVQHAIAIERSVLDRVLLDAARAAGAAVLTGATVTDLCFEADVVCGVQARTAAGDRTFRARLTVGADGLRSRVARRLGAVARAPRVRKLSLTTHAAVGRDLGGFGEMHSCGTLCVGVAPVSSRHGGHNITLVADAARYGRDVARDPRAFFTRALRALPALDLGTVEPHELLASGPFDSPMRRTTFDGAALVGDAAGYFDPFTGQGVYQAMAGATALANVVTPALERAQRGPVTAVALAPYAHAHRALTRPARRVQHLVDGVLSRPRLARAALGLLEQRPRAAAALIAVTADLRPARTLLSPRFALALLTPGPRSPS